MKKNYYKLLKDKNSVLEKILIDYGIVYYEDDIYINYLKTLNLPKKSVKTEEEVVPSQNIKTSSYLVEFN
tara:strand:- start:69 stop:278 length:210 start_codon:yes stop_codon:yes gene_type:complete